VALVIAPFHSIDASGTVSGVNVTKWRGLHVARTPLTVSWTPSAKRTAQQNRLKTVAQAWGAIAGTVNRDAWERYAETIRLQNRMGVEYIPTGFGIFMKLNLQRVVLGLSVLDEPLPKEEPEDPGSLKTGWSISWSKIWFNLGFTQHNSHNGYGTEYFVSPGYTSEGRKPIESEWLFLLKKVPPAYYVIYGATTGLWYWIRARQVWESGWVGNWFVAQEQAQ